MLEVGFFGQPRFASDGAPFRLSVPPKALLLLAYLLLHRNDTVSHDALSFTIWPDESEDGARARLRKYLYRLIKALPLGAQCVRADGSTLAWNGEHGLRFDVATFRERYRSRFFAALDERLLAARQMRDLAAAQRYARHILAADPWREDVVRMLMSLKYEAGDRAGDRAGALRLFDEFAERVREEMDVAPMSDTTALRDAILRGTLQVRGEADESGGQPHAHGTIPLVGREQELQTLRRAWQRAARGSGALHVISGKAGIGKTRLVQELALLAESEGARVLWGAAGAGATRPYQSIAEAIEQSVGLFVDIALERQWLDALTTLIPTLRDVIRAEAPVPISPEREQPRLIEAIVQALLAIASTRPTILVLEDVQWASTATCLAIERLASVISHASLLVILTQRDDETPSASFGRIRSRLLAEGKAHVQALGKLDADAICRFVRAVEGEAATTADISRIEQLTGGNPLLMLSALQAGMDGDAVLPATRILLQRFDGLPEEATHFAEVAAVAGSRFGFDLVRETVACSEREAFDALNALQDARIVEERPGAGAFELRFTHALLREALYERMAESVRRALPARRRCPASRSAFSARRRLCDVRLRARRGARARATGHRHRSARFARLERSLSRMTSRRRRRVVTARDS